MPSGAVHASCVLVGERGILVRGEAGSGKSRLVRELLAGAALSGRFARLVCDDRLHLEARHGRLVARSVEPIEGRLEVRGLGIIRLPFEPAAVIRLVVDCVAERPARWPDDGDRSTDICGVLCPRLAGRPDDGLAALILARYVAHETTS